MTGGNLADLKALSDDLAALAPRVGTRATPSQKIAAAGLCDRIDAAAEKYPSQPLFVAAHRVAVAGRQLIRDPRNRGARDQYAAAVAEFTTLATQAIRELRGKAGD